MAHERVARAGPARCAAAKMPRCPSARARATAAQRTVGRFIKRDTDSPQQYPLRTSPVALSTRRHMRINRNMAGDLHAVPIKPTWRPV